MIGAIEKGAYIMFSKQNHYFESNLRTHQIRPLLTFLHPSSSSSYCYYVAISPAFFGYNCF